MATSFSVSQVKALIKKHNEAHYVENPETVHTKNIQEIYHYSVRLLFMTDTALENKIDEMTNLIGDNKKLH